MNPRRRASSFAVSLALLVLVAGALGIAACGDPGGSGTAGARAPLVVAAASSLKSAFTAYGDAYPAARVRLSFGGSDLLDAQLRQGARPDVFAAANTKLPDALFADGLAERPVVFAGNRLVLAVPAGAGAGAGADAVRSVHDLAHPGVTVAMGSPSVPVGGYTRKVLARLPPAEAKAILANVRSSEPDVAGVVGKLAQGAVDAGFVYVTDVAGSGGRLRAIELPARLRPQVAYGAVVVTGTGHEARARAFVASLRRGPARRALRAAGFTLPSG